MKRKSVILLVTLTLSLLIVLTVRPSQANAPASVAHNAPDDVVQAAWQRATEVGVYDFATEMVQTTHPAPLVSNAGRASEQTQIYMEGQTNVPAQELSLTLWQEGGSALDAYDGVPSDGVEIRFAGDQVYGRQIGGAWQEIDDFSGAFAPGRDLLAYLAGVENVRLIGEETPTLPGQSEGEARFTHYTFDVDGPAFARYLRDQLEDQLRASGELPLNMTLDTPRRYVETTGEGEIWLDERGLPARLRVHLAYPPNEQGERIESEIQTDFFGFPAEEASALPWDNRVARAVSATAREQAPSALMFAISLGMVALLVTGYRSRQLYAALVLAVLASMIVTPLLQSHQAYAFSQKMGETRAEQEREAEGQAARREAEANLTASTWHPHQDPMANRQRGDKIVHERRSEWYSDLADYQSALHPSSSSTDAVDTDADGLSDAQESFLGTDAARVDSDGDGLQDGSEALTLGTDPLSDDSDADQILDQVEVEGFDYAGEHWYLDPNNPDTNGDGRVDALECPELMGIRDMSQLSAPICDPDGDGTPNPFDFDDDDDGVPDKIDLSPEMNLDRDGAHTDGRHAAPFSAEQPFAMQVNGLGADGEWPVLVDLQYRPANPDHLAYALSVLDWPTDSEGQVQHVKSTTFSDQPGDMRLLPMLEIEITGESVPFKLTAPEIAVSIRGALSATLHLTQQGDQIQAAYSFDDAQSYTAMFYAGACGDTTGAPLGVQNVTDGAVQMVAPGPLTDLADGEHAVVISGGGESVCTTIGNIVNGPYENQMIDPAPLEPYGISVREGDRNGTLLAYAPANVVKDTDGGGKAAFASRLLYWPGAGRTWEQPQDVRLVWVVEMLTDWCDAASFTGESEQFEDWCRNPSNRTADQIQIVHTYDDDWYLTGLSVREDLGLDVAIAYEDPATDGDPAQEDALWHVARGLADVFAVGRDSDENQQRDIAITAAYGDTTIQGRFDRFSNGGTSTEVRWGIAQDMLRVETFQYAHQDHLMQIAMHETPRILEQFAADATPTLLFAREEHYRIAGLDAAAWDEESGHLTLAAASERVTTAGLQWASYRHTDASGWAGYPIAEYWDHLEVTLTQYFQEQYPEDAPSENGVEETNVGRMAVARAFYASLVQGIVRNVEGEHGILWTPDPAGRDTDAFLTSALTQEGDGLKALVVFMGHLLYESVDRTAMLSSQSLLQMFSSMPINDGIDILFETLGAGIANYAFTPWTTLLENLGRAKTAAIGSGVMAGALLVVGVLAYAATQGGGVVQGVTISMLALSTLSAIWGVLQTTAEVVRAAKSAGSMAQAISSAMAKGIQNSFSKGGLISAVIGVMIAWAVFALTLGFSDLSRAAIGYAVSALIASIIVTDIMFAISLIPIVGAIIVAVVNAIDTMVALLCGAFLSDAQQQGAAANFLCGGLTGLVTALLEAVFYSNTVMVDMQPEDFDRLQLGNFEAHELVRPEDGFIVGNRLRVGVALTTTLQLADRPASVGAAYAGQWDQDTLKSSTFRYKWQIAESPFHEELSRNEMEDEWRAVSEPSGAIQYADTQTSDTGILLTRAGLNYRTPLFLSEGYAIPYQECVAGVCYIYAEKDTFHYNFGNTLNVDVFPPTLDEFLELEAESGGYRLAWDHRFPILSDADGDGLSRYADPDDSRWDTDGDGLSDLSEYQRGADPISTDTDGDGLTDYEEARLGTSPIRPDTDGDGLSDYEEVHGWDILYGFAPDGSGLYTRVTSDPLAVDADGDTLTDFQEKVYGLNPNHPSNTTVLSMASVVQENGAASDGFVRPDDTFHYEATLKNELNSRYAQGLFSTRFPQAVETGDVPPASFTLYPQEAITMTGDVRVSPAASGPYSLTQVAGASILDWSAISGGAQLWIPFEDEATSATKTYQDRSGNVPTHDGQCVGDGCFLDKQDGRYGGSLRLNGGYVSTDLDPSEESYAVSLWFKTGEANGGLASVEHTKGAQLYLEKGKVCARIYSGFVPQTTCSKATYHDNQWHHVIHTFDDDGVQRLYVDGVPETSGLNLFTGKIPVNNGHIAFGHSRIDGVPNFTGYIDDVRVYDTSLSETEALAFFNQPVMALRFDEDAGWPDRSSFGNDGACEEAYCPDHGNGILGGAASFNGANCLHVGPDASLDLSAGRFSIAAWVYPQSGSGEAETILGAPVEGAKAYPTLQRAGLRLRFGFGTGDAWAGDYESGEVLTEDAWNHVALTFDGDSGALKLYVDGALVDTDTTTFAGDVPSTSAHSFGVGCSIDATGDQSAHFFGRLDEVRVYRETLDADAVQDLYDNATVMLRMSFDEPPGAKSFAAANGQHVGACSGDACPTSGVAGRINQAARFWGDPYNPDSDDDSIRFPNGEINRLTNDFTLAAWIKPSTLRDNYEYTLLSTGDCNGGGFSFYLDGAELRLRTNGVKEYTSGFDLTEGRWTHVAVVLDHENTATFYVNGVQVGQMTHTAPATGSSRSLLIGASTCGSTALRNHFDGAMDDLVIFRRSLSADEIGQLHRQAPIFQMHFEATQGATTFADDSGNDNHGECVENACPHSGFGIVGQIGQAVAFDGDDADGAALIAVPDADLLDLSTTFSVAAWVRPTAVKDSDQTIVEKGRWGQITNTGERFSRTNYRLYLAGGGLTPVIEYAHPGDTHTYVRATSPAPLMLNQWNHVVGVYDGDALAIYVNGYEQASITTGVGPETNDDPLRIGGTVLYLQAEDVAFKEFAGRIDEVTIYDHALTSREIHDTFVTQASWVEDRQSHHITVDDEAPATSLASPVPYWPLQSGQLLAFAHDPTSRIVKTELGIQAPGQTNFTWADMPQCLDAAASTSSAASWCPTFTPGDAGAYTLKTRATDQVGHVTESAARTILVDDAPPVLDITTGASMVNIFPHPSVKDAWLARIQGTVSDPALPDGTPGSGIPADGVRVSLYTADAPSWDGGETLVGAGDVTAEVNDMMWTVDYLLSASELANEYLVRVEAEDNAAHYPGIGQAQLARHTAEAEIQMAVDAVAPAVQVDLADLPTAGADDLLNGATTLSGDITERPVPLNIAWETGAQGEQASLVMTCNGQTIHTVPAGAMEPSASYTWRGDVHQGATCEVTAPAGDLSGSVAVCGAQIAAWSLAEGGATFTADSDACPAETEVAGVDKIELGWRSLLPGSLFHNQPPPEGQALHLPFEDTPTEEGNLSFQDVSGGEHTGQCAGESCPTASTGHASNGMRFDGVDDVVTTDLSDVETPLTGDEEYAWHRGYRRTVAFWFKAADMSGGERQVLYEQGSKAIGFNLYFQYDRLYATIWSWDWGSVDYPGWQSIQTEVAPLQWYYDDTPQWHHVALVIAAGRDPFDNQGEIKLYLDGRLAESTTTSPLGSATSWENDQQIGLGRASGGTRAAVRTTDDGWAFEGMLDDVRVFADDLSVDEIQEIYVGEGVGPVLALSFDKDWITDGDTLADDSDWAHEVTLHTSDEIPDPNNKSVPGHVGAYALELDGVDDYISVAGHSSLDLSAGEFTQAAWLYPTAASGLQPIFSSSAYEPSERWYPFIYLQDGTRVQVGFGDGNELLTYTTGSLLTLNAWNHVATTFDGTTTRIYVNGQEQATTMDFAGKLPYDSTGDPMHSFADYRFNIGQGATSALPPCATLTNMTFSVERGLAAQYRIKLNDEVIFTTPMWPNWLLNVNQTLEFCATSQLDVEMFQDGAWISMFTTYNSDTYPIEITDHGSHQTPFVYPHDWSNPSSNLVQVRYDVVNPDEIPPFAGKLDDVRIYPRALSAQEISFLSSSAAGVWQAAAPTPSGEDVDYGTWSTTPPEGLEGEYRLDLRGADMGGHVAQSTQNVWRDAVDTLAPRLSMTRVDDEYEFSWWTKNMPVYRYTTVAEDYNLDVNSFRSPCGGSTVAEREYYQTPAYVALAGEPPLYRLRTECVIPLPGYVGANFRTPGIAQGLAISGTLVYVADGSAGVEIVDVSDPRVEPEQVGRYGDMDGARALSILVESTPPTTTLRSPRITSLGMTTHTPALPLSSTLHPPSSNLYSPSSILSPLAPTAVVTHHVTPTGAGGCTTWADACDLQTALTTATWGDEIWVAEGAYTPTTGLTRTIAFTLNSGIALYGGFAATETLRSQRDWETHLTILSGDIGVSGVITDNAYHVVTITTGVTEATVLDGFTITSGYADDWTTDNEAGGGIYNAGGSPTLRNLVIQSNHARSDGGGMYSMSGRPVLNNVSVISNTTTANGGGLMDNGGGFVLRDVLFRGNVADGYGGGLYNSGDSDLVNVTFERNTTNYSYGGGMANGGASRLVNVAFYGNVAAEFGGDGGGMVNYGDATLVNVIFTGNEAVAGSGGGLYNDACTPTLINATFSGNQAVSGGSAIHNNSSNATVQNSILWGNGGTAIANASSTVTVTYSLIEGGWTGAGNLDTDPRFTRAPSSGADTMWGTADDDYGDLTLLFGSPALDAGDNTAIPTDTLDLDSDGIFTETLPLDFAGHPRQLDVGRAPDVGNGNAPLVDMGVYELARMDLALAKAVTPTGPELGNPITYTLAFSNPGSLTPTATCVITDTFPAAQVISTTVISSGAPLTPTGAYVWEMSPLAPGQGGVITITGVVSPGLTDSARFTNTAVIDVISGALGDVDLTNNRDAAVVAVSNLPPVAAGDAYTTDEDVPLVIAAPGVLGNDSDGDADPLAAVLDAAPSSGELTLRSDGAFTYTPALDVNGVVSFTYHASDGAAASNSAVVTLTVNSIPDDPRAADIAVSTLEDTPLAITVIPDYAYHPDGDPITLDAVGTPAHGAATVTDPASTLVYTPSSHYAGTDAFTYTVRDLGGARATATITVTVNEVNYPPHAQSLSVETPMDTPVTIPIMDYVSDPDGDPVTLVSVSKPWHGSAVAAGETITYTPPPGFRKDDWFYYTVADSNGSQSNGAISIRVVPPAPTGAVAYVGTTEGLLLLDIQNPANPQYVSDYDTAGAVQGVAISGTLAYVADTQYGLRVIDVATPTHPVQVGALPLFYIHDIVLSGRYAYVASAMEVEGLRILDLSDPTNPQLVSNLDIPGTPVALDIAAGTDGHTYAYVAAQLGGLQIVDVTDPADLQIVGAYDTVANWVGEWEGVAEAQDVVVVGHYAYVGTKPLHIIDISDPANPQRAFADYNWFYIDSLQGGEYGRAIAIDGDPAQNGSDYVHVAMGSWGLHRLKLSADETASVCDTAGQCITAEAVTETVRTQNIASETQNLASLQTAIINVPPVLDSADPISVTVMARSVTVTLQALTATLDGAPIYTQTWASGAVTSALESFVWTPGEDGLHHFDVHATAWDGATATHTLSVTVDTQPPELALKSEVLTSTHYREPRTLALTGVLTDAGGVATVNLQSERGEWQPATVTTDTWRAAWQLPAGPLPDGATYVITATAQDIVGRRATVTDTVFADVVGPSEVTPTLEWGGLPIRPTPGDVVCASSPTLRLTWPAAGDNSGIHSYRVGWSEIDDQGRLITETWQTVGATNTLQAEYQPNEAREVRVQLVSRDALGNERWQRWGSVIVDAPRTPDYAPLTLVGGGDWMDSGCTLLGGDRRAAYGASSRGAMDAGQQLHLTWSAQPTDTAALRMAWTGASWATDSDLFIYLDVVDDRHPVISGTLTAFTPYTYSAAVTLPTSMAADYLLWVRDAESALLMHWDGGAWAYRAALTAENSATAQYQFDSSLNDGLTDLLLPFETISVTHPASATLGLVAFAAQDDGAVWAALPNANPIQDAGVETQDFASLLQLTHAYHWDALGAGVCPNGSDGSATAYGDIEGVTTLEADPNGQATTETTPTVTSAAGLTPVGDGQTIPYTFTYRNRGTITATGLLLDLTASGALRLVGSHQLTIEDVAPGEKATLRFDGVVDTTLGGEQAVVAARVRPATDPSGPPLDQRWLAHPVDDDPPVFFGLQAPSYLVGAGAVRLHGYAYDASGVAEMQIEFRPSEGGSATESLTCPDAQPHDGRWACAWNASEFSDGTEVEVRLQAVDSFGQASAWSAWQPLRVDDAPPVVTLDAAATSVISGSLVRESAFTLVGDVTDSGGVDAVQVCADTSACEQAVVAPENALSAVTVGDAPTETLVIDTSVACGVDEITRTFWVSESFAIGQVSLGLNIAHERRDDLVAVLASPAGTRVQVLGGADDPATAYANYAIMLADATSAGLFDARGDDTLAQVYGRAARPYQPLQAFRGEDAAGAWTLHICDENAGQYDGAYQRGRLALTPRHSAATSGRWMAQVSAGAGPLDYVSRTFTVSASDVVGNRSRDPETGTLIWDHTQQLSVWVDNVAPAITMTGALTRPGTLAEVELGEMTTMLSGTVSDGGPTTEVFVHLQTPTGEIHKRQAARDGDRWWFDLQPLINGQYTLWINARDLAGNVARIGPFQMTTLRYLYVPVILKNFSSGTPQPQSHLYLPLVMRE